VATFLYTALVHVTRALGPVGDGNILITLFGRGPLTIEQLVAIERRPQARVEDGLVELEGRGWVSKGADGAWQATPAGRATIERGRAQRIEFLAHGPAQLSAEEMVLLGRAGGLLDRLAQTPPDRG